jgi:hypothetical protein
VSIREKLRYLGGAPSVAMCDIPPGLEEWLATLAPNMSAWGFPLRFLAADALSRRPPSPLPQTRVRGGFLRVSHHQRPLSPPIPTLAPNASACGFRFGFPAADALSYHAATLALPRPSRARHLLSSPTQPHHPSFAPNARHRGCSCHHPSLQTRGCSRHQPHARAASARHLMLAHATLRVV